MPDPQPGQMEQRMERGDLRMIFTDGACLATPSMQRELGEDVWAVIGPIGKHTSHPELQDALGLVCMTFNRRHGRLSAEKHAEISRGHEAGVSLLLEATRPTADLSDDGELVAEIAKVRKEREMYYDAASDAVDIVLSRAADRLELYREALEPLPSAALQSRAVARWLAVPRRLDRVGHSATRGNYCRDDLNRHRSIERATPMITTLIWTALFCAFLSGLIAGKYILRGS